MSDTSVRIDKWLWAARLFKTRSLALAACRAGHVHVDGASVKASRNVRTGETVVVRCHDVLRTVRVKGLGERRVGPKAVGDLYDDLTPPEAWAAKKQSVAQRVLSRPKGAGRPTKRDRRQLDQWLPGPDSF